MPEQERPRQERGPSKPEFNYTIVAHDYDEFRRHATRRRDHRRSEGSEDDDSM